LQLLEFDPDRRITANAALEHEFFRREAAGASLGNRRNPSADFVTPSVELANEKEPSASHAEPAEAAVLPKTGKPGSSQVWTLRGRQVNAKDARC
jgi:hypothetical protein